MMYRRAQAAAFVFFVSALLCVTDAETTVAVVARPAEAAQTQLYRGNRDPLHPSSLIKLPLGSIRPEGWLKETLNRQRKGLAGRLPEVSGWLQKDGNAWLSADGRGKWGWEEVPYWLRGYLAMARQLDDVAMQKEAHDWIESAISSQRPDGNFGPLRVFGDDDSQDHWANMVMLQCFEEYFEYSKDERVLKLMSKYFRHQSTIPDDKFLTHFWQYYRGGDNLQSVYWLYNRTGEKWLLKHANKIHRNTANWRMTRDMPNWHGVNLAEAFNEPAVFFLQSHERHDLDAAKHNFQFLRERFGQMPGGMFAADENARVGYVDPRQGVETCAVVEQLLSDQQMMQITAERSWADHLENVAFNTLPATMMPDCRSLRYLTCPNQVSSDRSDHAPGIENIGPMFVMNPLSHRCCQHNHASGWTTVIQSLWMATPDNGLCAAIYGPGSVKARVADGITVTVREETHYPFEEEVRFTIELEEPTKFPVYLPVPSWCSRSEVFVNGVSVADNLSPSKYVKIQREWKANDVIKIKLPMTVRVRRWKANHNSVSVDRGPLTYSLKIGERVVPCNAIATAAQDSQWREGVDVAQWPAFEIFPTTAWNFGLKLDEDDPEQAFAVERSEWPSDDFPFDGKQSPISLRATARRIPGWEIDLTGMCGRLQDSPVYSEQPDESVELIPMGAARLRLSLFPEVRNDKNLRSWRSIAPQPLSYKPTASFCNAEDSVEAVVDEIEPCASNDRGIKRLSFLPHLGTREWIRADFDEPRTVDEVSVYWCDDESRYDHAPTGPFANEPQADSCRAPLRWQMFYRQEGNWQPVETSDTYGVEVNRFNKLRFTPVKTSALRLEITSKEGVSAGVLEWQIRKEGSEDRKVLASP